MSHEPLDDIVRRPFGLERMRLGAPEPFPGGGINLYLIDSPNFHGLSPPPRWGRFFCW
jgi:hypothetical protein